MAMESIDPNIHLKIVNYNSVNNGIYKIHKIHKIKFINF